MTGPRHGRMALAALLAAATFVGVLASSPAAQGPPAARGLIWELTGPGRSGWLVGSLHVLTAEHYPLPETMESAFRSADTLVEEVDLAQLESPQVMAAFMLRGFYTGTETLESQLPRETWALVRDRAARLGVSLDTLRRMRPWMAGMTLVGLELQRAGFDAEHGIDTYFRRKAGEAKKTFRALETAEQQIEYLAGFPPAVQEQLLRSSLEDADRQMQQVDALVTAWRSGDAAGLERLLLDAFRESPEVYRTLIVDRNRRWAPEIDTCLQRSRCFVVVGAGHTVGADGLVSLLRERGLEVRQR